MTPDALMHHPWVPIAGIAAALFGFGSAMACCALMAVLRGHTDRSRQQVQILRLVIQRLGWKEQYFADLLGITTARLSRAWAGLEALNLHRFAELPHEFHLEWVRAQGALLGARVLGPEELALIHALSEMPHGHRMSMLKVTSVKQEGAA